MRAFAEALGRLAQGDQGNQAAVSQEMETVRAGTPTLSAAGLAGTILSPVVVPPAQKKLAGWKIGLIVVAGVAVLVFLVVLLAGGFFLASRMATQAKPTTAISSVVEATQGISTA